MVQILTMMTQTKSEIFQKIYEIVAQIPRGKVLTYKIVAEIAGTNPRVVGFAMHANKNPQKIPCHRVIKHDGSFAKGYAFGGVEVKIRKLQEEGVLFVEDNRVNLEKSLYQR